MKGENIMSYSEEILSLHKYYIFANQMQVQYFGLIEANNKGLRNRKQFDIEEITYMSLWYGMLYVVLEGYKGLKLKDELIDNLTRSTNIKLLYQFRNGVFHFQKNYFNKKFLGLIAEGGKSAEWIISLHAELGRFLLKEMDDIVKSDGVQ